MPTLNTLQVRVFRNLTKGCYSIQAKVGKGWRTVAHADDFLLDAVTFKVSEAGRQRTLRTGRKQVHAWVCGRLVHYAGTPCEAAAGLGTEAFAALFTAKADPCTVGDLFRRVLSRAQRGSAVPISYRRHACGAFVATFRGIVTDRLPVTRADCVMGSPGALGAADPR